MLRVKTDAARNLDKFKARIVAKVFRQVEGLDYEETFARAVRFESVKSTTEHGIYVNGEGENRVFLALYVGDLLLVWFDKESLLSVKGSLSDNFKMKDLGSAEYLLGVEIRRRSGGGYFLVQEKSAQEVVKKFGMGEAKMASTPFEHGSEMGLAEGGSSAGEGGPAGMADIPYRSVVGSLMYLIVCIRPDLSMALSALSKYYQAPQPKH